MIIYKTTNLVNGKIYVGQTKKNKNINYLGSGVLILKAIQKYGKHNFFREILCECSSRIELNKMENYWVEKLNSRDLNVGYNLDKGGKFKKRPSNIGKKISKSKRGKKITGQALTNIRNAAKKRQGIPHSKETREKISKSNTGNHPSKETREKISKSNTGKKLTTETKQKISNTLSGRKLSSTHKKNISLGYSRRLPQKICNWCKKEFQPKRSTRIFCSKKCQLNHVHNVKRKANE